MHTALTLANYLASKKKQEVIFIELAKTSRIYSFVSEKPVQVGHSLAYLYKGVAYIPSCSIREAREVLLKTNASVVLVMEEMDSSSSQLFALCQKKLVVGSMAAWCSESYISFIRNKLIKFHDIKQISFCGINLKKIEKQNFKKMYDCNIRPMPYIKDPFYLAEKDFQAIEQLLV